MRIDTLPQARAARLRHPSLPQIRAVPPRIHTPLAGQQQQVQQQVQQQAHEQAQQQESWLEGSWFGGGSMLVSMIRGIWPRRDN